MSNERAIVAEGFDEYRALAHPIRRKILELAAVEPITAKELAAKMEMSTTRLYRHIDSLCKVGLLEVAKEVPKRGVVERWFQVVDKSGKYEELRRSPEGMVRIGAAQTNLRLPAAEAEALLRALVEKAMPYHREGEEEGDEMVLTISLDAKGEQLLPTDEVQQGF